jgi:hypothetical protein
MATRARSATRRTSRTPAAPRSARLVVCPALAFDVEGGTVQVSNNGTYPSTATYACEGGDPPSDGDAERTCQPDGI